jgi:hypothetical protein
VSIAKVTASVHPDVKRFAWVRNHHFIELEDKDGRHIVLNASGVLVGRCEDCSAKVIAFSHLGHMLCTHCGGGKVAWAWTKPQIAFIPEQANDFAAALADYKIEES